MFALMIAAFVQSSFSLGNSPTASILGLPLIYMGFFIRGDSFTKLPIPGWRNAYFSSEGFAKGDFRSIAELLRNHFRLYFILEQMGRHMHTSACEIFHGWLSDQMSKARGEC